MLKKVISGGQTGIDRIGLEAAKECNIETGGVAPRYYRTESGNDYNLKLLGLTEHTSYNYEPRTEDNVVNSDGTVVFGNTDSAGSKLTIRFLYKHNKPFILNPTSETLKMFIEEKNIEVLNVAGNRLSKLTHEACNKIKNILLEVFKSLKNDK
jgi:predicted Rossmann-fold nucleotide-binding protein